MEKKSKGEIELPIKHLKSDAALWKKLSRIAQREYKEDIALIKKLKKKKKR